VLGTPLVFVGCRNGFSREMMSGIFYNAYCDMKLCPPRVATLGADFWKFLWVRSSRFPFSRPIPPPPSSFSLLSLSHLFSRPWLNDVNEPFSSTGGSGRSLAAKRRHICCILGWKLLLVRAVMVQSQNNCTSE